MLFQLFIKFMFLASPLILFGCSSTKPTTHGKITTLSAATSEDYKKCIHKVPEEVCTRCHSNLVTKFKEAKDWCPEHDVPESQCFKCHPDLTFDPLPPLPPGADLKEISEQGEDIPDLEAHAVKGKITIFDFYAVWCAPCRKIDAHVFGLLKNRDDLAVRKLNVVSWETPLAKRYLKDIQGLPYIVIFDKTGKRATEVAGFDLKGLDKAIEETEAN